MVSWKDEYKFSCDALIGFAQFCFDCNVALACWDGEINCAAECQLVSSHWSCG